MGNDRILGCFRTGALALAVMVAVTLVATVGPAPAQQPGLADQVLSRPEQPRPRDCYNANMLELGDCAVADFRLADRALNAAYKKARGDCQDDRNRALLLESQRAWLRLRDADCGWESDLYRDGSMAGLKAVICLVRMTRERTKYLEHAFDP